ncbi:MAG: 1-deoxy-D-xylulose-5-phosphate reductoisomerase [Desulfobacterales bacterium]|nr:1-deoxy-D-xylulose-5-phosphate reductoisomerase [Desulfobacterales bacterium]
MNQRRLSILGSTGSIGRNALSVVRNFQDRFSVAALAAGRNVKLLAEQIRDVAPEAAAVFDEDAAGELKALLPGACRTRILHGDAGYAAVAAWESAEVTLSAMVGAAGLRPTLAAIDAGHTIALANKETLVMAGGLVTARAAARGVRILPVDSEHSAIFQCLQGQRREELDHILLTASGGPFLHRPAADFDRIRPAEALRHPNWTMGSKITIDSATLMNKGLEVIEASWLFDVPQERVRVVVHPQSIVHSMVAFRDGVVLAQLGTPDMKPAIAYALSYPERLELRQPLPDFSGGIALDFRDVDRGKFPCLGLAEEACRRGGTLPAVLNAANEVAVEAFLTERIGFTAIARVVEATMLAHDGCGSPGLEDVIDADRWARRTAAARVAGN